MKLEKKFTIYIAFIFILQFLLASKHLQYGFNNDDWYVLAWFRSVVNNYFGDASKAWTIIGPHNFSHAYYIGILFELFKFNFSYYHILNTIFKALAVISFFPVAYFLFKNKFLAYLIIFVFAIHFTPFGALNNVLGGKDFLMVTSMNLFFATYIWASQKHRFSLRVTLLLSGFLLLAAVFDITRFYPVLFMLPFLEIFNLLFNKSSTTLKGLAVRLFIYYMPYIILVVYSPQVALQETTLKKLINILLLGDFQLIVSLFASYGSIFVPAGLIDQLKPMGIVGQKVFYQDSGTFLYFLSSRFLGITFLSLFVIGAVVFSKAKKFIVNSLLLNIFLCSLAALSVNHWLNLSPKLQTGVDPIVYIIQGLIGSFIFSTAISFFIEWLKEGRKNNLVLALALAPIASFVYIFLTWIMVGGGTVFMGVHAYLNVASIGASIYLAILFFLAFQKLQFKGGIVRKIAATLVVIYLVFFVYFSTRQIDEYYSSLLSNGFDASGQRRINTSFWKEVRRERSDKNNPTLVYLDGSEDSINGTFYSNSIIWDVDAMLAVERGDSFDWNFHCKVIIFKSDLDKIRIENIGGKKMIIQNTCGYDIQYPIENFYAFRMIDRDMIPIRSEVFQKLGIND